MTDQTRSGQRAITLAVRGEGQAAAALGSVALNGDSRAGDTSLSPFAAAIDKHGGCLPLPYGQGQCWMARTGDTPLGMIYVTPPIRWLDGQPAAHRNTLVGSLIEIELLAVSDRSRKQGIGSALLTEAENAARAQGTHLALAKIKIGAFPVMRWYRKRGYTIAAQGEPVVFGTRYGLASCDDGADGYQLAVKTLQPGAAIRRRTTPAGQRLVVERDTSAVGAVRQP